MMTFCFFLLFSDFWSTAILHHISSGLMTASWLFKKKKKKGKKRKKTTIKKNRNPDLGNPGTAPPSERYSPEILGQVLLFDTLETCITIIIFYFANWPGAVEDQLLSLLQAWRSWSAAAFHNSDHPAFGQSCW